MTRPADWTPERQEEAEFRRAVQLAKGVLPSCCAEDDFTETWYAHCWLMDGLKALGCPIDGMDAAAKDVGNAMFQGRDPWYVAKCILEKFRQASQSERN